ncbi:extracellular solute-binding protein [Sulfitobacter sp. AS92]|uniref:sensor histidine kinase n=1 Tax=Sulfitobacter sp. AS92 TaxID=3135783 RepID=UPI0031764AAA
MTERPGHSLQRRLLFSMAAGFAILLILISILLWTYARSAANRTHDLLLAGAALSILERVSVGPDGPTVDMPYSALEILSLNPVDRVQYRVFVPGKAEITGSEDLPFPTNSELAAEPAFYDSDYRGAAFRFVLQGRRLNAPTGAEWVAVQVGQTVEERASQQWSFFLSGLIGLGALSLIGLGFVWVAIRTSLSPLRQIAGDLRLRAPNDLSPVKGAPPREIRGLFDAINGFITRLDQSRTLTETFIADVAHQTRTSLSALQGHLALAVDAEDFDGMRARVVRADRQADRTVRLTNQLLANAMVIHRSDKASMHPVALRSLVRDTLAESLKDSRMRKIALSFEDEGIAPGRDMIHGDALSIREALRNLIENAVRHGPADNTVTITLDEADEMVRLSVDDAGPGIAEPNLAQATERFTSLSDSTRGSGLGLSIVKAVAEGHDAELRLGRSLLGGLNVTLIFKRLAVSLSLIFGLIFAGSHAQAQTLRIYSATDTPAMQPLIDAFIAATPGVEIDYVEFQTIDLYQRILNSDPDEMPDVVISSAMDLQVDLVNRGLAQRVSLPVDASPPEWAAWRSELFGFTFEPAAVVYDRRAISASELPANHRELATFVRANETRLQGRIGSYDLRASGVGYLYASQDSLQGPQAQRLIEVLGRAGLRIYCCTSQMVEAVAKGDLAFAVNTIGSYASSLVADMPHLGLHFFEDYNLVMTRTAFVPAGSRNPDFAASFVTFLLSEMGQRAIAEQTPLIPIRSNGPARTEIEQLIKENRGTFLPIKLTPALLTFLDVLKKQAFLSVWDTSLARLP